MLNRKYFDPDRLYKIVEIDGVRKEVPADFLDPVRARINLSSDGLQKCAARVSFVNLLEKEARFFVSLYRAFLAGKFCDCGFPQLKCFKFCPNCGTPRVESNEINKE